MHFYISQQICPICHYHGRWLITIKELAFPPANFVLVLGVLGLLLLGAGAGGASEHLLCLLLKALRLQTDEFILLMIMIIRKWYFPHFKNL